jgi:hypothetical protein
MTLRHHLDAGEAARFISALPTKSPTSAVMWALPAVRSLRLSTKPAPGAVSVAGPERLAILSPLLRFATGLRAYGPDADAASAPLASTWQLDLPGARLTIGLSPDKSRGFSGEGGLLTSLASGSALDDADVVRMLLAYDPRIDVLPLASAAGLSPRRTLDALDVLASNGQVGYDLAESAFFHRPLPFDHGILDQLNPRIVAAREIVASNGVLARPDGSLLVYSTDVEYRVVLAGAEGDRCSCPWYARYRGTRGPCKHVLAARITTRGTPG